MILLFATEWNFNEKALNLLNYFYFGWGADEFEFLVKFILIYFSISQVYNLLLCSIVILAIKALYYILGINKCNEK